MGDDGITKAYSVNAPPATCLNNRRGRIAATYAVPCYPKMESLAVRWIGGQAVPLETKDDGQEVDTGHIQLTAAHTLKGWVVLRDGKPIPPGMRVTIGADQAWDSQIIEINLDGSFEFHGLPSLVYGSTRYHRPRNPHGTTDVSGTVWR